VALLVGRVVADVLRHFVVDGFERFAIRWVVLGQLAVLFP
jgi:hypothetical protein